MRKPRVIEPYERILLAMSVGDSLGFPAEGLRPERLRALGWSPWIQRFVFSYGMVSDDTDHACLTAEAIFESGCDVESFQRILARKLRFWFLTFPPTMGFATARAILKSLVGIAPEKCGVDSAGNGPAMRSAIIGAIFAEDTKLRREYVAASTRFTHTDKRALMGAQIVADCVAWMQEDPGFKSHTIRKRLETYDDPEWQQIMDEMRQSLNEGASVGEFALALELEKGITGYIYHTVPMAIYAWLRHREEYRRGMESLLDCGGDTDTVGAIYSALAAAELSSSNQIPAPWHERIIHWPRMEPYEEKLRANYSAFMDAQPVDRFSANWFALWVRNVQTFFVILFHALVLRWLPASIVRKLMP